MSFDIKKEPFHLFSDSSCDLPRELSREKNISVVPFYVSFDGKNYFRENEGMSTEKFYQKMVDDPNTFPKSSMPSIGDFADAFLPYVEAGVPVICICITSKFSGSVQSAKNARDMLREEYPHAKIHVIDARINTVLQGLYVLEAAKLRDAGTMYEDSIPILEEIRDTGRIFFTVGSMDYLQVNGRIGKVAVLASSKLGIRPIITLKEGEIFPSGVSRKRNNSLKKSIDVMIKHVEKLGDEVKDYVFDIGYGYDLEEAEKFREMVLDALEKAGVALTEADLPIYRIGSAISVHTGPYAMGISMIRKAIV